MRAKPGLSGSLASTPVADANTIYVQELNSDVVALNQATGAVRWSHRYNAQHNGPSGLAVSSGRVYGETDHAAFALASENGRELWQRHLANAREPFVDAAPIVWDGLVFTSTIRRSYALDESTGRIRWRYGAGGIYAGSIDAGGRLYAGTANPTRSGGTLPVLDAKTGKVLGTDRGAASILAMLGDTEVVFGAGQAGRVVAWDGATNKRRWTRSMGTDCGILGAGVRAPAALRPARRSLRLSERDFTVRRARRKDGNDALGTPPPFAGARLRDGRERRRLHGHARRRRLRLLDEGRKAAVARDAARGRRRVPCARRRPPRRRRRRPATPAAGARRSWPSACRASGEVGVHLRVCRRACRMRRTLGEPALDFGERQRLRVNGR